MKNVSIEKIYCVVKDDQAFWGTKERILQKVCDWNFIDCEQGHRLIVKFNGFPTEDNVSFAKFATGINKDSYTRDEAHRWVIERLFNSLPDYGYEIFERIA